MSAMGGLRRRIGLEINPLNRRSDRIQVGVLMGLAAALVLLTTAVSWWVGVYVYHQNLGVEQAQRRDRHATPARLLSAAQPVFAARTPISDPASAAASWSAPDGSTRHAVIPVQAGLEAGSVTTIWTDTRGQLTLPPRSHQDVKSATLFAVYMTIFSAAAASIAVYWLVRHWLDYRRYEQWQREWRRVGPEWSRRP